MTVGRLTWNVVLTMTVMGMATAPLLAQQPDVRGERLRRELELRFAERVQSQLGLTPEQGPKVGEIMNRFGRQRQELERKEREFRQILQRHLRPGIAANPDSLTVAVDGITANRVAYTQLMLEEMKELSTVLTPVQRAQLFQIRDQILQRAQELRDQRQPNRPPGPPAGW